MSHIEGCPRPGCYVANCRCPCHEPYTPWMRENNEAVQVPVVERADIPLETDWSDRTAALAEALNDNHVPLGGTTMDGYGEVTCSCGWDAGAWGEHVPEIAKDALLYLREHGWTMERS